jgi:succinoglycan biosynthesis transport protein ExoP
MAENSDQIIHFHEYFKIIRNRLWVIFTIFTLTVLSGYYVTNYVLPKVYTSTSQIQLRPSKFSSASGISPYDTLPNSVIDPMTFQAEFTIMQSSDVLMPIITNLQLDKIWAKRVYKSSMDAMPPQDALAYMNKILHLDFVRSTNIINITVSSEVSKESADIANAIADQYKTMRDVEEQTRNDKATNSLREQIDQQTTVVADARKKVEDMRQELGKKNINIPGGASVGVGITELLEQDLESRKKDLLAAQEESDSRSVMMEKVMPLPDDQFVTTLKGMNIPETDIDSLTTDVLKDETDITSLLNDGFEANHPRVQALQAEMAAKKQQITELVAGLRRAMVLNADVSKSRVALLQGQVDEITKKIREDTSNDLVPFRDAQRELADEQNLLDTLKLRLQQLIANDQLQESPVRIISRADPPAIPSKPNKSLNYAVSVLAGLVIGVGVAFLIEYLDTSVKTMADAETLLGLPVLTVIPNKGGPMPLVQDSGKLPHAEGYRILRAKLDLKVQNGIGPSLTMLSGGPGEGKSTTIYNLAVVCAQAGQSVILVDCDLRRPTLHELLGLSNERGISNFLRGEGDVLSFIQRTPIPKMQVLTAGNMPMSEIGVLAGDKIRIMLDELKQRYDLVLIDAPPVLGISDGSIIAREVDYVILVIQHRRYPREISLRAKRAIEEVHGNCVGMVLNCVAVKSDDSYYYYSSYGNYYKKKPDRAKKRKDIAKANGKPEPVVARKTDLDSEEF